MRCAASPLPKATGFPSSVEGQRLTLRQAINDVGVQWVTTRLQKGEPVDAAFMAHEITHSLIDMVLEQDEKHQGRLLAQIVGR